MYEVIDIFAELGQEKKFIKRIRTIVRLIQHKSKLINHVNQANHIQRK